MTSEAKFTFDQKIAMPNPEQETLMAIRRADWERLKRRAQRLGTPPSSLATWYSVAFGFAGSAALSCVSLLTAASLPAWVIPFHFCATIGAVILGVAMKTIEARQMAEHEDDRAELATDMSDIEGRLSPTGTARPE